MKISEPSQIIHSTCLTVTGTLAGLITWRIVTTSPTHHTLGLALGLSLWVVVGKQSRVEVSAPKATVSAASGSCIEVEVSKLTCFHEIPFVYTV